MLRCSVLRVREERVELSSDSSKIRRFSMKRRGKGAEYSFRRQGGNGTKRISPRRRGPLVKWLRQRPLTPLTSVRIRYGSPAPNYPDGTSPRLTARLRSNAPLAQLVRSPAGECVGGQPPGGRRLGRRRATQLPSGAKVRKRASRFQSSNAPLAQLVEQLTLNQWVPGSSP